MEPAESAAVEPPEVEVEVEGIVCPDCGEALEPRGKMAPALVIGLHRKAAHGVEGRPRNKTRRKRADAEPEPVTASPPKAERPVVTLLHGAGQDAKRGRSAPDADGLARALGRIYGYVGYFAWSLVVDRDPTVPPQHKAELVAQLAPTGDEGIATVHPLARILAQTQVNKRYGAGLIDNLDVADCVAAIGDQMTRARQYLAARGSLGVPAAAMPPGAGRPPAAAPGAPVVGADGVPPNPMQGGYAGPADPSWGTVVDADTVAQLRQRAGAGSPIPAPPGPEWAE